MELGIQMKGFRERFEELSKTLDKHIKGEIRERIASELLSKMPDTTAYEELPDFSVRGNSAPTGAKSSANNLRGKRTTSASSNNGNQLKKILYSFVQIE